MKTFTQSVDELSGQLQGQTLTYSQLLLKARNYLVDTGTRKPSKSMIGQLAEAVYHVL